MDMFQGERVLDEMMDRGSSIPHLSFFDYSDCFHSFVEQKKKFGAASSVRDSRKSDSFTKTTACRVVRICGRYNTTRQGTIAAVTASKHPTPPWPPISLPLSRTTRHQQQHVRNDFVAAARRQGMIDGIAHTNH